jgi:hypothetical protein
MRIASLSGNCNVSAPAAATENKKTAHVVTIRVICPPYFYIYHNIYEAEYVNGNVNFTTAEAGLEGAENVERATRDASLFLVEMVPGITTEAIYS